MYLIYAPGEAKEIGSAVHVFGLGYFTEIRGYNCLVPSLDGLKRLYLIEAV